jgi:hypothetical protein
MIKQLFLVAGAVLALASCTKDVAVNGREDREISFRSAVTRGEAVTTANLTNIYVSAFNDEGAEYFTNTLYKKGETYFTCASTPAPRWVGNDTYHFFAYAPASTELNGKLTLDKTGKSLTDFKPGSTISNHVDFITATATGSSSDESVHLTFQHRLSMVEIQAKNTSSDYTVKVKGVRIGKNRDCGDFDFETSEWTLDDTKSKYDVTYNAERELTGEAATMMETAGDNAILLPQQLTAWDVTDDKSNDNEGAYISLYVNITQANGTRLFPFVGTTSDYGWVSVPIGTNWEAGKKYIYILDFSNGGGYVDPEDPDDPGEKVLGGVIKFEVDVEDWVDSENDLDLGV